MRSPTASRDARRPPAWLPRALLMTLVAVFAGVLVWRALTQLGTVITIIVVAWFLSLAMEPVVRWLARRGMRRGVATGLVMFGGLVGTAAILAVFGQLFVVQLIDLFEDVPALYADLADFLDRTFGYALPPSDRLLSQLVDSWGSNVAQGVIGVGGTIIGALFILAAVLLVAFYMVAQGPAFRSAICRLLAPDRQREVLRIWEVSLEQVSNFLISRIVLAAIATLVTFGYLTIAKVPYALPLAAFTGLVSQFVPTVGTYIGGALPVAVALSVSPLTGVGVLIFIVAYQQVENLLLAPRIAAQTMSLNAAVAFLAVIAFGAVFGALGAFLSLPVVATIKAVSGTYLRRHELVDSALLDDRSDVVPGPDGPASDDPAGAGSDG
ncbi:AI-2E family transporter [Cellulomonas chengniuliangii]|uniref:AI-2E family transporter n=1 Tax=Cellulomonas chengniuliangii TaxID=2968084 RepID=A0ABY5L4A8_9CELL|nr:AI-2E family transporter [Cellulomonas chengniuliangii]MCC2308101.1 AI-2E family transporter [Cellulomonas chengniuliangii]MCC2318322.1 AI-2E family transporter [Cellulomonas chengniuliangii]UUI76496.1 AI-2E family transporter [Cellulomonas chengniuliangii]